MKKFYIHNGTDQQGPFEIEDLKAKNIKKETPIWYEGLSDWTSADNVEELKELFSTNTPPPFTTYQVPLPVNKQTAQTEEKQSRSAPFQSNKKSNIGRSILIFVISLVAFFGVIAIYSNMNKGNGHGTGDNTYQEKVMTIQEIEQSQPTNFLTADGNYNQNFWGDKIKVHGLIKNNATVATYKDAVVKVTYYSKTKTELGSKEYTIYETFPPHSEVKFELKIENYKDVNSIGWDVIQAKAD